MKKILLFTLLVLSSIFAFSQFLEGDSLIIYGGGNFEDNVQVPDPVDNLDAANKQWVLSQSTIGADSIPFDINTGEQKLYKGGLPIYTASFVGRWVLPSVLLDYLEWSDTTTTIVTVTQLNAAISGASQVVYSVALPFASTIAGRIALAVESTEGTNDGDYPYGWVLTADGLNILITHGLGRRSSDATVWQVTTGTQMQKRTGTNAYDGLYSEDVNTVRINSLTTVPKDITIYLEFAQ